MRVGLIACSKTKLDHAAPAHELYQGQFFKLAMQYVVRSVVIGGCNVGERNEWGILSAGHGLVMPNDFLEPYDIALGDMPKWQKEEWEVLVQDQLMEMWGDGVVYTVLAGADYRYALKMPMMEDLIGHWTRTRRDNGMTTQRASMGIGVLKKHLKQQLERLQWMPESAVEAAIQEGGYTFEKNTRYAGRGG